MQYLIPNATFSGVYNSYSIMEYTISKINKSLHLRVQKIIIDSKGVPETKIFTHNQLDVEELVIDPNWNAESTPIAKPEGFSITDPTTWGNLSWDDIPKTLNQDKLFVTSTLVTSNNIEQTLFNKLIEIKLLPSGGELK